MLKFSISECGPRETRKVQNCLKVFLALQVLEGTTEAKYCGVQFSLVVTTTDKVNIGLILHESVGCDCICGLKLV